MKKFFGALLVAVSLAGISGVQACGGMTQTESTVWTTEEGTTDVEIDESIMSQLYSIIVIC